MHHQYVPNTSWAIGNETSNFVIQLDSFSDVRTIVGSAGYEIIHWH
jgi:hypothetical protein